MNRDTFLTQIWTPYPAMPPSYVAAGRVRKITPEDFSVQILLERKSQLIPYSIKKSPTAEVLVVGDLVAVLADSEVMLLAPFLGKGHWPSFPIEIQEKWQIYLRLIRQFFGRQDFLELKTPSLVVCPGTEPSLDVFSTELKIGSKIQKLFLPTSPEIHLKKALALGADKIFELAPCFRNGEKTERHLPEFLMLEWYRSYDNLKTVRDDVVKLLNFLCDQMGAQGPQKIQVLTVAQLFQQFCDFNLQPNTTKDELYALAARLKVDVRSAESIDDYFFLIFTEFIEAKINSSNLVFVEKYPPYQAALARLTEDGWGDRFEVYWKGLELANAFHELNDPQVQRMRSQEDLNKKMIAAKEDIALDEDFFIHLEAGMPPSAGIAVGVERLFMCLCDMKNIEELKLFRNFRS